MNKYIQMNQDMNTRAAERTTMSETLKMTAVVTFGPIFILALMLFSAVL